MMAQIELFVMFIVFRTCHGTLQCKHDGCNESTSRYTEPYESQSVLEEIAYMISPGDFYYKFVAKHIPLVLRKTATNWPATKVRSRILFMSCHDLLTTFLIFHHIKKLLQAMGLVFKRAVFIQKEAFQVVGNHSMAKSLMGRGRGRDKICLCGHGLSSCLILRR